MLEKQQVKSKAKNIGLISISASDASQLYRLFSSIPIDISAQIKNIFVPLFSCNEDDPRIKSFRNLELGPATEVTLAIIRKSAHHGEIQKLALEWAFESNLDVVVFVHGGGLFPVEFLPDVVEPILSDVADIVIGSRFSEYKLLSHQIMPWIKYAGNIILTNIGKSMTNIQLTDWHSGFRAMRVDKLTDIPINVNSDGFNFDFQFLLQCEEAKLRVSEVPITPYSGDNMSLRDGFLFMKDVIVDIVRYRSHKIGFGTGSTTFNSMHYDLKDDDNASHGQLLSIFSAMEPTKVLDVGCSDGKFGSLVKRFGHVVTGIDCLELEGVRDRLDAFYKCDLDNPITDTFDGPYNVILAADVIEHLRNTSSVLNDLKNLLTQDGMIIISLPNISHWYARLKIGLGLFDYDRRGIFDVGHLRFFTKLSFTRIATNCGLQLIDYKLVPFPISVIERGGSIATNSRQNISWHKFLHFANKINNLFLKLWPSLFAYQMIFVVKPKHGGLRQNVTIIK
jgi:SAM-dependent methyltransferase